MGRKAEPGITYYQMHCNHTSNKKVKLLFNDHDSNGYWIWQCLLAYAYEHNGYYFDLQDEDELILFASDICKKSVTLVKEVIASCIARGLFDRDIADTYQVLTSDFMQEVYLNATSARRSKGTAIELVSEYLLLDLQDLRNISIVQLNKSDYQSNNEIVPENNPIVLGNNSENTKSHGRKRVKPTVDEEKLKAMEAEYNEMEKTGAKLTAFIETKRPSFLEPYVQLWNVWAAKYKKSKVGMITDTRRGWLSARLKEKHFDFVGILRKASESDFCLSGAWFTFDWVMKSKNNFVKVLEGQYKNHEPEAHQQVPAGNAQIDDIKKLMNNELEDEE